MTETTNPKLSDSIKKLGYAHNSHIRLYGELLQLVSDPIVEGEKIVFVEGMELKSRRVKRLRIPLPVVMMAPRSLRTSNAR
jgi:hypothetical protein